MGILLLIEALLLIMASGKEYELVPIKPIKDLQSEIKKLTIKMSKGDNSSKEVTKILNSNIEIQKTNKATLKKLNELKDKMSKLVDIFENVEEAAEEDPHPELMKKLEHIEKNHDKLEERLDKIVKELRRLSYFKERLPPGLPIVYKRS